MSVGSQEPVIGFFFPIDVAIPSSSRPPPGGEAILFTGNWQSGPGNIYKVKSDGTGLTQVTTAPSRTIDVAAWAPDGTRFAVTRQFNGRGGPASVLVVTADGSSTTTVWTGGGSAWPASQPSWTADGSQIVVAYEAIATSGQGIGAAFVNADGSGHTLVPITVPNTAGGTGGVVDSAVIDSGMYLSPDGTTLAFTVNFQGVGNTNTSNYPAVCAAAGGTATLLTTLVPSSGSNGFVYGWYSDSQHLLCFTNDPVTGDNLVSVKTNNTGRSAIFAITSLFEFDACLSPDGTEIAHADGFGLGVFPSTGGSSTPIVPHTPLVPAQPDWGGIKTVGSTIEATAAQLGIRPNNIPLLGNLIGSA